MSFAKIVKENSHNTMVSEKEKRKKNIRKPIRNIDSNYGKKMYPGKSLIMKSAELGGISTGIYFRSSYFSRLLYDHTLLL